jgi:hypothetical protein
MLDTSIAELHRAVDDVRHQIATLDLEAKLFDDDGSGPIADPRIERLIEHLQGRTLIKRRFVYCGLIITVSGMLEQYLDALVAEYVQTIMSVASDAGELPKEIGTNHLDLSLTYLDSVARDSYRGDDSVEEIISRLHSALCVKNVFVVNERAFAFRRANYRCDLVSQVFAKIGVSAILKRLYESFSFSEYLRVQRAADDSRSLDKSTVLKQLDDLAERRNDVAHGNVTQILSHELVLPFVEFVEAFGSGIREVLIEELFQIIANRPTVFHRPFQVIDNSIVCIKGINYVVRVGDFVVAAVPTNNRFLGGIITNLQVNNKDVEFVDGSIMPVDVGLEVDARLKNNYWYGVVPKERIYRTTL